MKIITRKVFLKPLRIFGPDAGGDGGGDGQNDDGKGGDGKGGSGTPKLFTQEQVDEIINKRFAKTKTEKENLVKQLETLQQNQNLTTKERDDLQKQIDDLNNSMLSKDQQAAAEREKITKKHSQEIERHAQERDLWKNRFFDSTISRAITDAAVSAGGEYPEQFVLMFKGMSQLSEEKGEDGKPTGNFVPMIKFQGLDDNKKPAIVEMPVAEAFSKMKEWGLHKNLFKHGANAGAGSNGSGGSAGKGGNPDRMPVPEDFNNPLEFNTAYQSWRDTHTVDGTRISK